VPQPGDIYVFDAFGTLFDVHSAARRHAARIGEAWPRVSEIWRGKQLEYSWIYAGLGAHMRFEDATREALQYALTVCKLDPALASQILPSYRALDTFEEVVFVLSALKATNGARLAILSNGDPDVLSDLIDHAKLNGLFEAVISVATAGTFKPNARVYAQACNAFDAEPSEITFLSSNRWDIAGASAFGFVPVWVNRAGLPDEYIDLPPQRTIRDLRALLD
jgi:2-haloacid dehalogenase